MPSLSSTGFGAPCFATLSIAQPTCSVVVKYLGRSAFNSRQSGRNAA
jgi:hypothetical protein